jgi:hypothetical protein
LLAATAAGAAAVRADHLWFVTQAPLSLQGSWQQHMFR